MPFDKNQLAPVVGKRIVKCETFLLDAWHGLKLAFKLAIDRVQPCRRVGRRRRIQRDHYAILGFEAEVLVLELAETTREHSRTCNQDHRQSSLDDQQRFAGE